LVRTVFGIESNSGLKSLGSTILGKFLSHKDNNYKYIALNTLQEVAKTDLQSVQKHKNIILDCLKDTDASIRLRSLDLVYLIINSSNIKQIVKECLNFLLVAENEFKLELTTKVYNTLILVMSKSREILS
jgi:AP-1 complex subunit gamma-1